MNQKEKNYSVDPMFDSQQEEQEFLEFLGQCLKGRGPRKEPQDNLSQQTSEEQ